MPDLSVPAITDYMSSLDAALAYADAGFYVGPVKRGTKHPGTVIGDDWQRKTSRDHDVINSWFPGTDHGVYLHAGRSGALIFDVDNPDKLHPAIKEAISQYGPPYQSTRPDQRGRGHYVFKQPEGRTLGNGVGKLASGWGEVRGLNGVIIVAPSEHENAADGGFYRWCRTGPVPALPGYLSSQLPDALDAEEAATDAQVVAFLGEHNRHLRRDLLDIHMHAFLKKVREGESRHSTMTGHLSGAMKEAAAGLLDAKLAADTLESVFLGAVAAQPIGKQGEPRTGALARNEWRGLLAWAVAQASAASANETLIRIADKFPLALVSDDSPDQVATDDPPAGADQVAAANEPDDQGKKAASTLLIELATERYDFGVTEDGQPYAVPPGGHVVRMLRGGKNSLRAELAKLYYRKHGRAAPQQPLAEAILTLEGIASDQDPASVHLRVAAAGGAVWLDLGDVAETVVRIDRTGWQLVSTGVPVLFRRTELTGVMPHPQTGGTLEALWQQLNVSEADRSLVLAWMVAALVDPDMPHPILALLGEQGTGKSNACRRIVGLVDPSPVPLRKPPRDADSWVTAAAGSWVVGLDNMSQVPEWLSDSLCRAATGEGDVKRQLYTDGQLAVFAFRRCILLNGIDVGALRGDLADRLVLIALERISETARATERKLTRQWDDAYPTLLGALLDLAAGVAGVLPSVQLDSSPRMADFAAILTAVDQQLGTKGYDRFTQQARTMAADSLSADPFLAAIGKSVSRFTGTAAELLTELTPASEWRPPRGWPKDARAVTSLLKRNAPALRKAGWTVEDRMNRDSTTEWELDAPESDPQDPQHPQVAGLAGLAGNEYGQSRQAPQAALCATCDKPMTLDEPGQTTHPACEPAPLRWSA